MMAPGEAAEEGCVGSPRALGQPVVQGTVAAIRNTPDTAADKVPRIALTRLLLWLVMTTPAGVAWALSPRAYDQEEQHPQEGDSRPLDADQDAHAADPGNAPEALSLTTSEVDLRRQF